MKALWKTAALVCALTGACAEDSSILPSGSEGRFTVESSLDFGTVAVEGTRVRRLTFVPEPGWQGNLEVGNSNFDPSFGFQPFSIEKQMITLVDEPVVVPIFYSPTEVGVDAVGLPILCDNGDCETQVDLRAEAKTVELSFEPRFLDFGLLQPGCGRTLKVVLRNESEFSGPLGAVLIGRDFTYEIPSELAANGSAEVDVSYSKTFEADYDGVLQLQFTVDDHIFEVEVNLVGRTSVAGDSC